jgi:hypothetical protein
LVNFLKKDHKPQIFLKVDATCVKLN